MQAVRQPKVRAHIFKVSTFLLKLQDFVSAMRELEKLHEAVEEDPFAGEP
jgi:hypothetical protein